MGLNKERKNYTIGRGDLFFAARRENGTLAGERLLGNTPELSISVSTDSVKHYGSARGMRVQDREVPTQTDYSASFVTDDVNPKNLAALFLGTAEIVQIAALATQTETFTDTELGLTYQVGISAVNPAGLQQLTITAVKVGTTALTEGTDYTKDNALGRVTLLEGAADVSDGNDVIVEYDRAASEQERVTSGAKVVEGALRFVAYNPEGDDIDYYLPAVKLSPNGDFAIKSDSDWQKMPFKVAVNTPVDGEAIYANGRAWQP